MERKRTNAKKSIELLYNNNSINYSLDALQVPAIEEMLVNLDLGQKIPHLSVNHQFGNVRGGKRIGTKTSNVIKVLGHKGR